MKLVTTAQMRELDRRTIEEHETSGETLMDRAGLGVAEAVRRLADVSGFYSPLVHLIAGRGNNGGDAFAAARHLKKMGFRLEVWLAGAENQVKDDALKHLSQMRAGEIPLRELPTKEDWEDAQDFPLGAEIVVDGVLGTGSAGPARGPAVGAIQYINSRAEDSLVVAIDVPSGLDADTGRAEGDAVVADVTVTMGLPKRGLVDPAALEHVGTLEVVDIGIPDEFVAQLNPEADKELIYLSDLKELFPRRARVSHKGDYGHVLLVGGAAGYSGAIAMAARAAMRSGVGLATVLVPEGIAPVVASASLESMVIGVKETAQGSIAPEMWGAWRERLGEFDALLVGPGLTRHDQSLMLVRKIIRDCEIPLIMDADALSVLEGQPHWIEKAKCPVIITPHPGELARLFSQDVSEVQRDRYGVAMAAAKFTRATVVLKGAGTLVVQDGKPVQINLTGNPGMATGGSGDVLAGLLAGLLGQKMQPFDAARAAVYIHGRAGDMAAWRKSQAGLIATDLIEEVPYVFRELSLR